MMIEEILIGTTVIFLFGTVAIIVSKVIKDRFYRV
jgi:hypothetical protein